LLFSRATSPLQRIGRLATLAMLVLGSALAFAYLAMTAAGGAATLAGVKAFPEHFVGWRQAALQTEALLALNSDAELVADNFMLAAELDFAFDGSVVVYSLDHPINAKHGRAAQLALWQRDEATLARLPPRAVLIVAEPTARRERERGAWMESLCTRVSKPHLVVARDLYDGRKRYRWYRAVSRVDLAPSADCAAQMLK